MPPLQFHQHGLEHGAFQRANDKGIFRRSRMWHEAFPLFQDPMRTIVSSSFTEIAYGWIS
jgi:hypothetical protein